MGRRLLSLMSWLKKFLVQVLVGCLVASCLVVILLWSKFPDIILFWILFAALDVVTIATLWFACGDIKEMYMRLFRGWKSTAQKRPLTPNLVNTILTVALTTFILPVLFWALWRPSLLKEVLVLTKDQVVSSNVIIQRPLFQSSSCLTLEIAINILSFIRSLAGRGLDITGTDHPR